MDCCLDLWLEESDWLWFDLLVGKALYSFQTVISPMNTFHVYWEICLDLGILLSFIRT